MKLALSAVAVLVLLTACAAPTAPLVVDNANLPEAVRVPPDNMLVMGTSARGELTYECREKKDLSGKEWVFVGPVATLYDSDRKAVGKYYAGPTWESTDGSRVTAKQVAVAPNGAGNIPLQLVKAEPATGLGAMQGVSYIQRLNTQGGVAPGTGCDTSVKGQKRQVAYSADYVFYRVR